jgi:twitching motility protein PilU
MSNTSQSMERILRLLADSRASDVYLSANAPAMIKIHGQTVPVNSQVLEADEPLQLLQQLVSEDKLQQLEATGELNTAVFVDKLGNFRISAFRQRGKVAVVIRYVPAEVPSIESLNVAPVLAELVMERRGLVLMVGASGSGKSTTLAAMLDRRNERASGHILTGEEPIEYVFKNKKSVVNQREVGSDTESLDIALKNALRQAPDVILMGEIRDRETMEHAVSFAETGHLCMATLHANSTNHALETIINFFPEERREQLLMDLSMNLRGMISQRLLQRENGKGRSVVVEVLLNSPLISELIIKGEFQKIKDVMKKSGNLGMKTFDQALFEAFEQRLVGYEDALRHADSVNDLRLAIKLNSQRVRSQDLAAGTENLSII